MSLATIIGTVASIALLQNLPDPAFSFVTLLSEFRTDNSVTDKGPNKEAAVCWHRVCRANTGKFGTGSLNVLGATGTSAAGVIAVQNTACGNLSNSDFTLEMWVMNPTSPTTGWLTGKGFNSGNFGWELQWDVSNSWMTFNVSTNGGTSLNSFARFKCATDGVSAATLWNGAWHHVAVVRSSGVVKVYVDGLAGSVTLAIGSTVIPANTVKLRVGSKANSTGGDDGHFQIMQHYIDEYRLTVGLARYTAVFTPPTAAHPTNNLGDANYSLVALLYNFEDPFGIGNFGSATPLPYFFDTSTAAYIDAFGVVKLLPLTSTTQYFPSDAGFGIGSNDFTLELFGVYDSAAYVNLATVVASGGTSARNWGVIATGTTTLAFQWSTNGGTTITSVPWTFTFAAGTAYNLAVTRSGSTLYLFVNGTLTDTATITGAVSGPNAVYFFKSAANIWLAGATTARLLAVRLTNGYPRYIANYIVPTLPLPKQ